MTWRIIALLLCTVVGLASPAGASGHTYAANAEATALKLTLTPPGDEPQGLTFGHSTATVPSNPTDQCKGVACATGAAAVEPFGETAQVVVTNAPAEDSVAAFTFAEDMSPLLRGGLGIASATATPAPGPTATGSTTAGDVGVHLLDNTELDAVKQALADGVDQVAGGLSPLLEQTPEQLHDPVQATLDGLADALEGGQPLLTVTMGQSAATTESSKRQAITTATATADGSVISLAPVPTLAPEGLFRVTVGEATATARTDGTTATKSSKGSIVKLEVANVTQPGTYEAVDVATDQPEQCFGESPLMLCIILGGTAESGEGAEARAVAGGVRVLALADADPDPANNPLPGLTLAVAEAIAGVNATLAEAPAPAPTPAPDQPVLPQTGGGLTAFGLAVLVAGGLLATRLRR